MTTAIRGMPLLIPVVSAGIIAFGLFGLVRSDELYGRSMLFERQLIWLMLSLPAMLAAALLPLRVVKNASLPCYLLCIVLLMLVLFMPPINGSRRWIPLGLFDLQPSEPARLAFILALASWLMYRANHRTVAGLLPPLVLALVPMLLIIREPDLDTALLFVPVLYVMLFVAGARVRHLVWAAGLGIACLPVLWIQMSAEQKSRIVTVLTQRDGGTAPAGDGYHLHQSKQVLALGGFLGSRQQPELPVDDPAAWQLPAARTDFIFVMIGEAGGFPACALVLLLYTALIGKGLQVARRTQDPFSRLVAAGIVTLMGVQTILNTAMTVGLLPITGTTLPLCSYGGSSLISTCTSLGLLMNIQRSREYQVSGEPFVFGC